MKQHLDFILTPMSDLLEEASVALLGIDIDISSYPMAEYFLKSLFLKMSGFQEQKLKCICWEMATVDYDYRYNAYSKGFSHHECSNYTDKCGVLRDIISEILKKNSNFDACNSVNLSRLLAEVGKNIDDFYESARLKGWLEHEYLTYKQSFRLRPQCFNILDDIKKAFLFVKKCSEQRRQACGHPMCGLIGSEWLYANVVYSFRNQCAHNTLSCQKDSCALAQMSNPGFVYKNYFVRLHLLTIIDTIFVSFYKQFLEVWQ